MLLDGGIVQTEEAAQKLALYEAAASDKHIAELF